MMATLDVLISRCIVCPFRMARVPAALLYQQAATQRMINSSRAVLNPQANLRVCSLTARPRHAPFDGISGIVITGRRGMARLHQAVDERLVLPAELVVESADIVGPMRLGARPRDRPGHQLVVEHPGDRELAGGETPGLGVPLDGLGDAQRFRAP